MERAGIINKVKIKMDELTPDGVALPFEELIGPTLDDCAKEIQVKAPLHLLAPTAIPSTGTKYVNNKSYIPVPTDYIKLYEMKYPLWKRSVRRAVLPEDPAYASRENEYLTGYARPFVAIVNTTVATAASKYFECSKVLDSATPDIATYVKIAKPEELNDLLVDALAGLCASKIFGILGEGEKAQIMAAQSEAALITIGNS